EKGVLIGYRGLDRIHDQLAPILLRRTRQEVLKDLPKRTDQILRVPLTPQQAEPYWEQNDILAALMRKWERQKWLSEIDQKRVPSKNRGALMEKFRRDEKCRVFLSTDAGGVGLNLQAASAVINFEPPWNPARLEQRIGRVHRLGQAHPVHVVHLLTEGSIEERVWETMSLKKSLFAGVFDSSAAEVSFAALGRKSVLQAVKEI